MGTQFFSSTAPVNSTIERISGEFAKEERSFYTRTRFKPGKGEMDLSCGVRFKPGIADPERLLETAYDSLKKTLKEHGIALSGDIVLSTRQDPTLESEETLIHISDGEILMEAGGIEGIRRGLYRIARLLKMAEGPYLPKGKTHLKSILRNRISRCFYGPTHRPPNNIDELLMQDDCYPEPYLDKLAGEGINILWLTVALSEVTWSSIEAPDPKMEQRLAKLEDIVSRCRRYGIRIFTFFIEPAGFIRGKGLVEQHPELNGVDWGYNMRCFCPSSETAYKHLYEQLNHLFSRIPHLGGVINIPWGEALCSCFFGGNNTITGLKPYQCPRCHDLEPWQVLRNSMDPMLKGMRDAAPEAEYICWIYQASNVPEVHQWVYDCVKHLPEGVIFLYNFESGISVKQQGKLHYGGDYWQALPGCSERFRHMAECAKKAGVRMGAKMQISNDHALATVPVIPVPGTLHSKFKLLHKLGVDTVMYSWYFGSLPGLMNRAAAELAQTGYAKDQGSFLAAFAKMEFGRYGAKFAEAWKLFSKAFACYPVNAGFQYLGPVNAGISWTLYPEAALTELTKAWQPYPDSGDCIGQCLRDYTIEEVIRQTSKMSRTWDQGFELIRPLYSKFPEGSEQYVQLLRAEACGIDFRNALLILQFYLRRREFYEGDRRALTQMEKIVKESIKLTRRMAELCAKDIFLGYHSEAEYHKYSPELLTKRAASLTSLLKHVFPRLKKGEKPSFPKKAYVHTVKTDGREIVMKTFRFSVMKEKDQLAVKVRCPRSVISENKISEQVVVQICDPLFTTFPQVCSADPEGLKSNSSGYKVESFSEKDFWGVKFYFPVDMYHTSKLAFDVIRQRIEKNELRFESWNSPEAAKGRSGALEIKPLELGLLEF